MREQLPLRSADRAHGARQPRYRPLCAAGDVCRRPGVYRALVRERYREHYGRYRILLHVRAAEEGATLTFLGPYAAEAQLIINTLFGQTEHPERVSAR